MTSEKTRKQKVGIRSEFYTLFVSLLFTALLISVSVLLSDDLAIAVNEGLNLSIKTIIPSVFPFLIISDVVIRHIKFEKVNFLRNAFERIFGINGCAIGVFACGVLCGFPMGAKLGLLMYENGKISKSECERLIAFSNNASPGYIIGVVGIGLFKSVTLGILLYFAMFASALLCGFFIKRKEANIQNFDNINWQKYSFVNSVKDAAQICLNICAFITVFSIIGGIVKKYIRSKALVALILIFLEIGSAANYISDLRIFAPPCALALVSFSISFSGLCVFSQTKSLGIKSDVSMAKYLVFKLLQGCISATIIILYFLTKIM